MKEINRHLAEIENKLFNLSTQLERFQCRQDTLVLVLSYLLAKQPGDDVLRDLSRLANEMDGDSMLDHHVVLLDELRKGILEMQAFWSSDPE